MQDKNRKTGYGRSLLTMTSVTLLDKAAHIELQSLRAGEHNHYVLCELLGISEGEFTWLVQEKAIY